MALGKGFFTVEDAKEMTSKKVEHVATRKMYKGKYTMLTDEEFDHIANSVKTAKF